MGDVVHSIVVVTALIYAWDEKYQADVIAPNVNKFRKNLPEQYRDLLVGPTRSTTNGYFTWTFGPCGSKVGWDMEEEFIALQNEFMDLFSFRYEDGSSPFALVRLTYDAPQGTPTVEYHQSTHGR